MAGDKSKKNNADENKISRRAFVVGSGTVLAGGAIVGAAAAAAQGAAQQQKIVYPLAKKYLVYDSRGCAGCLGCMLACSLVHDGSTSLSYSRIQVHRAVLKMYPLDIHQNVCRQCPVPLCVDKCPTGACHVSTENGNVRMIDEGKCIGCQTCLNSCPQIPHRIIWDPTKKKCTKCDMCVNTPYYNKKGGPDGTQACVEACPSSSLKVVDELPEQADLRGYDRNLQPPPKPKPQMQPKPEAKPEAKPKPQQTTVEFNPRVDVSKLPPAPKVNSPASKSKPGN
jgi:protein NrfC